MTDPSGAKKLFDPLEKIAESAMFARDLVSEPANIINPVTLAEQAKSLTELGVEVKTLGEADMKKLGMGPCSVSARAASMNPSWWSCTGGAPQTRRQKPIAFVGKGVTFGIPAAYRLPAAAWRT